MGSTYGNVQDGFESFPDSRSRHFFYQTRPLTKVGKEEVRFAPGARGDVHTHPHTQCTYVLEGEFVFTIEGREHTVRPGDTLAFASGEAHGCVCPAGGVLIDVFAPMREDFIR